jgi:hypothetical protein
MQIKIKNIMPILLSLVFACTNKIKDSSLLPNSNSIEKNETIEGMATTALPINPIKNLSETFKLDTITFNSEYHLFYTIIFPVSIDGEYKSIDTIVSNALQSMIDLYIPKRSNITSNLEDIYFSSWISSFYETNKLISMCFIHQSYSEGAAHYNHGYITLNYDLKKSKSISSKDFFQLTKNNRMEFDHTLNACYNPLFAENRDTIFKNTNEIKFYVRPDTIIFCFDDYEMEPSMKEIKIPKPELKEFINPIYY